MKKGLKNISRVLFSLLLIASIFSVFNVIAEEVVFKITKIEVKEYSDKVTINDVSLLNESLNNDIIFSSVNDYVKYDITIQNSSEDKYKILSITDDNDCPYLEYTYDDLSDIYINGGEEKTFSLTIRYKEKTDNITITDKSVNLILTYEREDGSKGTANITDDSNKEVRNPITGDNITIYIIIDIISIVGLTITTVRKKYLHKSLIAIALVSSIVLPFSVRADSNQFFVSFTTNKVQNSYSELIPGRDFRLALFIMSYENDDLINKCYNLLDSYDCNIITSNDETYIDANEKIKEIDNATLDEFKQIKDDLNEDNILSTDNSNVPTYVWYDKDNQIIYYYSNANKIYFNEDSSIMFKNYTSLENFDLDNFDTSNVINMHSMFWGDSSLDNLDVSNFNTANVTNMSYMFYNCDGITSLDLTSFDTSNVTNMTKMFMDSHSLRRLDLSSFDTSKVTNMSSMFSNCTSLINLNITSFDTSNVTDMSSMFSGVASLEILNLANFNTENVKDMAGMFWGASSLTSLDVTHFDTSKVTNMSSMFYGCNKLTELDVSKFNTSNVTDMNGMFGYCESLTELDVTHFDTSKVTNMSSMFKDSKSLEDLDVTHFNTENVENMSSMFSGCSSLTSLNVTQFNTTKVTNMSAMFWGNTSLTSLNVTNFNTSNVTDMSSMFWGNLELTSLDVTHFNTENVTDMSSMFYGCNKLTSLDVSSFDTANVTDMYGMFAYCDNLITIYVSNNFITDNYTENHSTSSSNLDMFTSSTKLIGGADTRYDEDHVDKTYARIDDQSNGNPGYFTDIADKP